MNRDIKPMVYTAPKISISFSAANLVMEGKIAAQSRHLALSGQ